MRVSRNGGSLPRWRGDGRELYFLAPAGKLMSVPVAADGTPGAPEMLFTVTSAVDFDPAFPMERACSFNWPSSHPSRSFIF